MNEQIMKSPPPSEDPDSVEMAQQSVDPLSFDENDPWEWRVEPMWRIGWWLTISKGCMQRGPDGGPYMAFGTRRRAIRKAERICRRLTRADDRRRKLSVSSDAEDGC